MSYQIFCPFCGLPIVSDVCDKIEDSSGEWQCDNGHTFGLDYIKTIDDDGMVKGRGSNQKTFLRLQIEGMEKRLSDLQRYLSDDIPDDELVQIIRQDIPFLLGMNDELMKLANRYVINMSHK